MVVVVVDAPEDLVDGAQLPDQLEAPDFIEPESPDAANSRMTSPASAMTAMTIHTADNPRPEASCRGGNKASLVTLQDSALDAPNDVDAEFFRSAAANLFRRI